MHTFLLVIFFFTDVRLVTSHTWLSITGMGANLTDICLNALGDDFELNVVKRAKDDTNFASAAFQNTTPRWTIHMLSTEHGFQLQGDSRVLVEQQDKTSFSFSTNYSRLSVNMVTLFIQYGLPNKEFTTITQTGIMGIACSPEYRKRVNATILLSVNVTQDITNACDAMDEELEQIFPNRNYEDYPKCANHTVTVNLTCPDPKLANGRVVYTFMPNVEDSHAEVQCNENYTLDGGKTGNVSCIRGQWQGDGLPQCKWLDCGEPPTKALIKPNDGWKATPAKLEVEYVCMTGYIFVSGKKIARCTSDLSWTLPNMVCNLMDCGRIATIPNKASVTYVNKTTTFHSVAKYTCTERGKSIKGVDTRVCQIAGWLPSAIPTCDWADWIPKVKLVCVRNCGELANPQKPVEFWANCADCESWKTISMHWKYLVCNEKTGACPHANAGISEFTFRRVFNLNRKNSLYYQVILRARLVSLKVWYFWTSQNVRFGPLPPTDGACEVVPLFGFSMFTEFNISCTGFDSIPDYGFEVRYYSNLDQTLTNAILLGTSGEESNFTGALLEPGDKDDSYNLYIHVEAVYVSGATTMVTTRIKVEKFIANAVTVDPKVEDVIEDLINVDPDVEGESMVDENLKNNDVNGALLGMELAIATMVDDNSSEEETDSGEVAVVDVEKQRKVHEALTNYLDKVVAVVKSPDELFRAATVLKKSAAVMAKVPVKTENGKPAPKPEPDEKTENLVTEMVDKFEVIGKNATKEQQTQVATLLLERLGDMLYTEPEIPDYDYDEEEDSTGDTQLTDTESKRKKKEEEAARKERGHKRNERLISQSDKLANVLLSSKLPGEGSTVLTTPQMKMSVAKMTPDNIESPDFGDDEDACKLDLPTSLPISDTVTDVGIQAMQIKSNPYTRDISAMDVNVNVLKIEIKDSDNNALTFTNLETPAVFKFPIEDNVNASKTHLVLYLNKTDGIIELVDDPSTPTPNVRMLLIFIVPDKTTKFSIKCEIPLLLHIGNDYWDIADHIFTEGVSYPEDVDVFRRRYSQFDDLDMLRDVSYSNTGDNIIIDFGSNNLGPYYAGITVDLNRVDIMEWLRSEDPECLGDDSVTDCSAILDVEIAMETKSLQCLYWDAERTIWTHEGCNVFPYTDSATLECFCTHMTSFSGGIFVMPNMVDPVMGLQSFLTFFDNPVVVTAVIVVWILYFFLIHWARQADKRDRNNATVLWSGDGVSNSYVYLMCIATGWWRDAGTTANVYCFLQGSDGVSSHRRLTRNTRQCFQSGFDDWIVFTTKESLGDLNEISFWHDNTGSSPHWYLKQAFVVDLKSRTSWTFIYNDWLALDRGSILTTVASVISVTKEELSEKTGYNFNVKTTRDLRDGHLWLSIFSKPTHSTFTRVQRLTCALSLILTTMLTNIMFYGIPTDDPADQVGADSISFSLSSVLIGIESSLLMFPINVIILQLFLKAKPRPSKEQVNFEEVVENQDHIKKPPPYTEVQKRTIKGEEMGNYVLFKLRKYMKLFRISNSKDKSDVSSSTVGGTVHKGSTSCPGLPKATASTSCTKQVILLNEFKEPGKILPWWSLYITWTLVIFISLTCSYFVMLYGLKYGYNRSVSWLVSFMTGFAQSAFVTQPLKVLVIATIITLIFKKAVEFENYGPEIKVDKDEIYENAVSEPKPTHVPFSEPLSSRLLAEIKERLKLEWLMDQTLRDIGLYVIYMTVLLLVVHDQRYTMQAFLNTNAVEDVLVHPGCKTSTNGIHMCFFLDQVSSVDHFYRYMHEIAVPNLADMSISDHEFATPGSSHFLLGSWRMRQLRVDKGSCHDGAQKLFKTFDMNLPECTGPYWLGDADTQSYNGTWTNKLPERPENGTQWSYQSSWKLKTIPVAAKLATYSGGGFVKTMHAEHSEHIDQIHEIFNTDWIDERTRAIFLEFTLYNVNADLFAVVMIIFEFSNNGAIIPSHQIYSAKLFHYPSDYAFFKTMCEFMFLFFNIGFTCIEWNKHKVLGKEYFKDFWSYIEILQISLSYAVIGIFFQRMISIDSIMEDYRTSDPGTYISFYTAISWDVILSHLLAFLVALNTMKSIKLLRFNKRAFMVSDAIGHSKGMLLSYMILAIAVGTAFCHFAVMAFGKSLNEYKDFWSSLVSIFNFILGVSDLAGLTQANRILGPAFFIAFIFLVQFCFITVFVAILNFGISESKVLYEQRKNKFELLQYVTSKCKTVLNIR